MTTPTTQPASYQRKKIAQICSWDAYLRLLSMQRDKHPTLPEFAHVAPEKAFYGNSAHREYLSRWMENVIIAYVNHVKGIAKKENTAGATIKTKAGKEIRVKHRAAIKGTPDVSAVIRGRSVWFEVKAPGDTVKADQSKRMAELEAAGALCFVIRTIDEFFQVIDDLTQKKC